MRSWYSAASRTLNIAGEGHKDYYYIMDHYRYFLERYDFFLLYASFTPFTEDFAIRFEKRKEVLSYDY